MCLANIAKLNKLYKAEKKNGSKNNPTSLWHLDKFEKCNKICYPQEYNFFKIRINTVFKSSSSTRYSDTLWTLKSVMIWDLKFSF